MILHYTGKMHVTIYFTAIIAATGKKHAVAVPDNYSIRNLRDMLSATTKIAVKELQLSCHGKLLPHRFMETVTSAGIREGFEILVNSRRDPISQTLIKKVDEDHWNWIRC
jgi:hypothetical protein